MTKVKQFIKAIEEEKKGFSFGKPWRFDERSLTAILPILRSIREKRTYFVLSEAKKVKLEDTGQIDSVLVTNNEEQPVFVRAGEIFKGKTQERAATISRVVMPEGTEKINVVCVHQSKPIRGGEKMKSGGFTPRSVDLSSQHRAWKTAMNFCATADATIASLRTSTLGNASRRREKEIPTPPRWSRMDDLASNIKEFSKSIETVLKKVPFTKNQVGVALLDTNGFAGMEAFNISASWKALKDDIVRREGEKIAELDKDNVFEYKPEKAKETVKKTLKKNFKEKELYRDKNTRTIGISYKKLTGEATILGEKVIHLNLTRKK